MSPVPGLLRWVRTNLRANNITVDNIEEGLEIMRALVQNGVVASWKDVESQYIAGDYTIDEFRGLMKMLGGKPMRKTNG